MSTELNHFPTLPRFGFKTAEQRRSEKGMAGYQNAVATIQKPNSLRQKTSNQNTWLNTWLRARKTKILIKMWMWIKSSQENINPPTPDKFFCTITPPQNVHKTREDALSEGKLIRSKNSCRGFTMGIGPTRGINSPLPLCSPGLVFAR